MVERIKAADFAKASKAEKRSKYGAKKTKRHGILFDSKKEADRWDDLRLLEKAGEISSLERQVPIVLQGRDGPILTNGGNRERTYVADFRYVDWRSGGAWVIEDSKGIETAEFRLKRAILAAQDVTLTIT